MEQVNGVSTATVGVNPTMNLGAIFAGWVVALGMFGLLLTGGLALGYSASGNDATTGVTAMKFGTAAWMILTWAGALFVGGMFASWFDGKNDTTMGTMHGVTVWGLFVAAGVVMMAFGHSLFGMEPLMTNGMNADPEFIAAALKVAFFSNLLGLVAAAIGGWLGSSHIHRVYHLRTYTNMSER